MNPILFFVLMLSQSVLQSTNSKLSNNETLTEYQPRSRQKLYIALSGYGKQFDAFKKQKNLESINYIDESMSLENGVIDYKKLKNNIEKLYPIPSSKGICFFDYEAPYIVPLFFEEVKSKKFKDAIALYIDVIKYSKKLRPKVKWSHYGIPFGSWDDKNFLSQNYRLGELFSEVDILMPSVYMSYDDKEVPFSRNQKYLFDNLTNALDIGKKYNKPVLPFVLHRFYNTANRRLQFSEMNDTFWKKYIQYILSINLNGSFVNGVVWWGADTYYYNLSEKNVRQNFNGTTEAFVNHNDQTLIRKAKIILDVLKL